MNQLSSTIVDLSVVGMTEGSLKARSLLAHSGHSNEVESQDKQQTTDAPQSSPDKSKSEEMPQMTSDKDSSSDHQKTVEKQSIPTEEETAPTANPQTSTIQSVPARPVTIVGESLLALLVASPFLLFALKKWFHK